MEEIIALLAEEQAPHSFRPMKAELFCLCDFASSDAGGKLNLIGVFDSIQADETPVRHGFFAIAGKVSFDASESGRKKFKVLIYDPVRTAVGPPMEAAIEVNPTAGSSSATAQVILLVSQIQLPSFGTYSIEMEVEDTLLTSTLLHVRKRLSHSRQLA